MTRTRRPRNKECGKVLGNADPPYIPGQDIILGRYGFRWLRRLD
jgi:hypothetical protein